jgi:hypothetical protein
MEEARALESIARILLFPSVRIGQVPVIAKPALIIADNIVSQPVDAFFSSSPSSSLCLKA